MIVGLTVACVTVATSVYLGAAGESKAVAVVLKTLGDVQAKQTKGWAKMAKGSKLYSGNEVQTKKDGYAAVMFLDDKSVVKVKPNSVLKVQGNYEGKTISKQIVMDVGELFVKVSKQKGSFQVATPTSVASVKGTEFWVIEGDQGTTIIGLEGLIELSNKTSGQTVTVGVGQTGTSGIDGNVNITETKEGDIPDEGQLQEEIKIQFRDADGNLKEVKIKY
jgi:ferric-dicitrate binding protein FerR (iron transport regulator)